MAGDSLRILLVSNRHPTDDAPSSGTVVPQFRRALERAGMRVHLVHINRSRDGRRAYLRARSSILKGVAVFEPDVVHVLWGGLLAWLTITVVRDRPVVVTFGGTDLLGAYVTRAEGLTGHASRFLAVIASRLAARRAGHVVLLSRTLASALPRQVPSMRCSVIPWGVDPTLFGPCDQASCRRRLGWAPERRHLLFPASSRRPEKRFPLAQAACRVLVERGHDAELHALSSVPHQEVPIWMNAADVVLLTSRHEGSPQVIREAVSCGRPIVSVDVGDVRDLVEGLESCRIAAPDPDSLADCVEAVWSAADPDRPALGRARSHSWEDASAGMERVYRRCVADARVSGTGPRRPDGRT